MSRTGRRFLKMNVVDGEIDLHNRRPGDLRMSLLPFLDRGYSLGWKRVRIIHGKGKGTLRRAVHNLLDEMEYVEQYSTASVFEGGAGVTVVEYGGTHE